MRTAQLDHLLSVDRAGVAPLGAQLEAQLRDHIRAGRLRAGTALPSTRSLAIELGIARGVAVDAYAQLQAEGFLVTTPGASTRVAEVPVDGAQPEPAAAAELPVNLRFDLRIEAGDLSAFPRAAWLAATRRALTATPDAALGYGDRSGAPELRAALAAYLGRARGVATVPERVVVTTGITQAVSVLAAVLRERGVETVAVEDPGFPPHQIALRAAGLRVLQIPVDDDGLRVDALAAAHEAPGAVLVTPAHQWPTGAALASDRRAALLAWAQANEAFVLEDDYDGEFRHDRRLGALQGLAPAHAVYLGSASKTLAPALRLGWMALPPALAGAVRVEKAIADSGSPLLGQLALADLITRGDLDRHLRRQRARIARREAVLLTALGEHLPKARIRGAGAGLHVLLTLPERIDLRRFHDEAWARRVAVVGYSHSRAHHVLLGYANLPDPAVEPAVKELAALVAVSAGRS